MRNFPVTAENLFYSWNIIMIMSSTTPVKAAKNSMKIVEALRELDGAGVSEVSQHVSMPTSTVHDHLQTLTQEEYLIKENNQYYIGTRFLQLGDYSRSRRKLFTIARPEVDKLAQKAGGHANLMIEEHNIGVFLYTAKGQDAVRLDTHAGMRVPLHTTALGKAIMAYLSRNEVEKIIDRRGLPKVTEKTITTREGLFDELETIREQGFATDDEERVEGMRCVAVPITNEEERAIAAVSISGLKRRMKGEKFTDEVPEQVLQSANAIEVNLTYS
jgi:DNA-binding IclR family transcriptional regulator